MKSKIIENRYEISGKLDFVDQISGTKTHRLWIFTVTDLETNQTVCTWMMQVVDLESDPITAFYTGWEHMLKQHCKTYAAEKLQFFTCHPLIKTTHIERDWAFKELNQTH